MFILVQTSNQKTNEDIATSIFMYIKNMYLPITCYYTLIITRPFQIEVNSSSKFEQ